MSLSLKDVLDRERILADAKWACQKDDNPATRAAVVKAQQELDEAKAESFAIAQEVQRQLAQ